MGKWTRRAFVTTGIVAGGGLVVGVAIRPGHRAAELAPLVAGEGESLVTAWVKIAADNTVTAIVPHSEMGQGAQTALAQMLADELDASWQDVRLLQAPAEDEYANYMLGKGFLLSDAKILEALVPTIDGVFLQLTKALHLQITGGSSSIRATGMHGMRVAGAAARDLLLTAAADHWEVAKSELTASDGKITHTASNRSALYAEFAAAAGALTPSATPRLKVPNEFTVMGKHVQRLDIPEKVDGSARFGIDAELPGMKYAAVTRAPVFGASVANVDDSAATAMAGVRNVVNLGDAVAVVADGYWQASQALAKIRIEWTKTGDETLDSGHIYARFEQDMDAAVANGDEQTDVARGDARTALANSARVIEASYRVPYLAHTCMEPMNATAHVHDGRAEVWTGSQNPLGCKHEVADALELDPDNVTVHNAFLGGGFGRRSNSDFAIQAARLSNETGVPVKLIWSREEDVRQDHYRPAVVSRFKAGISEVGDVLAWENQFVDKHEPAEAPHIPYAVPEQFIHYTDSPTHVPFGAWRSVAHSQHGFFTESFTDEVAHATNKDPFEFRRDLLDHAPRHKAVLELAAEKAGWGRPMGNGQGRGISLQESFGTIVAQVVDVTVDAGEVRVDRVVCAVDPGFAVSPDGLTAQMESGIIYGLTAALYGEVTINNGAVQQGNFDDYPMLRMDASPDIETHIINSGAAWGGAGEPGTPGIAPALANAIFDATGTRIRELPVSRYDLSYRITEPEEVI
ncbi:MAG: xanthine dehydrogenase family protein molybdopterin-binding subunit [Kiritimatiellia bacterium]|jgi:isoquinoline 1-oxidoreductase beta subunit|nr:xanthine dehydrogenase family protein molybdopterin-binding subunit [Pseudomonadales bacterium]MDP7024069.1 xanthine dehydrogenase family protein molybdopterin-binding subunit [Kiritimatiellia bacterium]